MSMQNQDLKECCPKFDPTLWDNKEFHWDDKKFVKDTVMTFFYIPLNFGGVMKRLTQKIERADAKFADWLCLSDHTSKWKMDLYLAVDKNVDGAENVSISGDFLSKVYEGDFRNTGLWNADFAKFAAEKGIDVKKVYMWYTTCPKCAKKYGKNYVVLMAQINK